MVEALPRRDPREDQPPPATECRHGCQGECQNEAPSAPNLTPSRGNRDALPGRAGDDHETADETNPETSGRARRRRLWEIDGRLHCSIIGTCLTLGDLHRIERRLKIEPLKGATDFQVHGNFVLWASQAGPVARQMHKLLERRYAVAIRRFASASSPEDLVGLWSASLQDGDIPGPYWALLTHPAASEDLAMQIFGQVHMLSHLIGAANRADIRRLMTIESERDALADAVAAAKRRLAEQERDTRRLIEQHAAEMRAVTERQGTGAARPEGANTPPAIGITPPSPPSEGETEMRRQLAAVTQQLAEQQAQVISLRRENVRLLEANTQHETTFRAVAAECDAMERLLHEQFTTAGNGESGTRDAFADARSTSGTAPQGIAGIDLGGRRIVYVGGRGCIIPHLRAVVERLGGVFLHHDGGLEERNGRLERLLCQGDAVFCPIDCISHDACQRAKRYCRQRATAFVTLRTCNLSSFIQGLRQLGDEGATDDQPTSRSN